MRAMDLLIGAIWGILSRNLKMGLDCLGKFYVRLIKREREHEEEEAQGKGRFL